MSALRLIIEAFVSWSIGHPPRQPRTRALAWANLSVLRNHDIQRTVIRDGSGNGLLWRVSETNELGRGEVGLAWRGTDIQVRPSEAVNTV